MKKIIIILLALPLFAIIGCNNNQPAPQEQKLQVAPPAPGPAPAPVPPPPPHVISPMFMSGYWDGYFGRYVSIRWAYFDYREGWNLGKFDRQHGINRFPR
jgi:uncharacterized lipoprotein NlpE involved in copper resistance